MTTKTAHLKELPVWKI